MIINGHLGKAQISYQAVPIGCSLDSVRVELLDRQTSVDGDELVFSNGKMIVKNQGCVALLLHDVEVLQLTGAFAMQPLGEVHPAHAALELSAS